MRQSIHESIHAEGRVAKGGKFLEAPVSGSKGPAAAGALIFLTGGDSELYSAVVGDELDLMGKVRVRPPVSPSVRGRSAD